MDAAPLVHAPPATVGELAAALGLRIADLDGRGVAYAYAWDIHHELPPDSIEALAWRALTAYRVPLGDATACETALREGHGEPVEIEGRRRYGHFMLSAGGLEWHAELPDWAVTAGDREAGRRSLAALSERLRGGGEPDEAELTFDPPLPAAEVAAALGAPEAFASTVDVHMSSWRLETSEGPIEVGGWRVDAALAGRPSGDPVPGVEIPGASARLLGGGETVGHLRVERTLRETGGGGGR
jgi:hypothetical protein